MGISEKLLNDYLFATTRYLDKEGEKPEGSLPFRFISSPMVKSAVLFSVGSAITFAAMKNHWLATTCLIASFVQPTVSYAVRNFLKDNNRPEFYFDTAPERSKPLTDPTIINVLRNDVRSLPNRLAGFSTGVAISSGTMALAGIPLAQIFTFAAITLVPGMVHNIGYTWRAKQVIKGNWNALPEKPDLSLATEHKKIWGTQAPLPTHG